MNPPIISARRASTGETRVIELNTRFLHTMGIRAENDNDVIHKLLFELADNNWSCDCNRCLFFDQEHPDRCEEVEYSVEWFKVGSRIFTSKDEYGREFTEKNST